MRSVMNQSKATIRAIAAATNRTAALLAGSPPLYRRISRSEKSVGRRIVGLPFGCYLRDDCRTGDQMRQDLPILQAAIDDSGALRPTN